MKKEFIKTLKIPFSSVIQPGLLKQLRETLHTSEHTPTRVLRGEWTNEIITNEALQLLKERKDLLDKFLQQFENVTETKKAS
jgi:hypothetical protein